MVPLVLDDVIHLECNFSRETNRVDVKDIEYYTYERTLGTASRKIPCRGVTISESQNHLPVLEIAQEESEEPLRDLESNENSHNNIMVHFVEGF